MSDNSSPPPRAMAKAIAKITAEASCPPGKDQIIVRFDAVKGFGLRVTRNQAKSYVIEYSIKSTGRGRRQTIGDVSVWTPEVAIVEARRLLQLVDRGKDPAAEQSADVAAPTVAGLVEKWRTEWAPHLRPRTREEAEKLIKAYIIPKLGKTKIAAVKPSDVARLHRGITARVSANRVVSLLHKIFALAVADEAIELGTNPAAGVVRNPETAVERYLETSELERLVAALPKCRNQQAADVVSLLLLSGARVGEVKAMRWDQISFERQLWVKPASATKQKRSHHVPLSPPAIEILLRIYETAKTGPDRFSPDNGCMWVFPNRASGKHRPGTAQQDVKPLGDIKNSWATICKNADVKNIRIHDLRHAYGTYLASSGLSLPIIGRLLGHSQAATTDRYVHAQMDPLRLAADRVAARVEAAKGAATAEIVKLPRPA